MFSNSVRIFRLLGFDIRVDPSWLLIAALIVWSLSTSYFPEVLRASQSTYLTLGVVAMLGLFGSLILHELAHSLVARHYGVEIRGITLFLFGGVAEMGHDPKSAVAEFWIAVAGPAMSFALASAFWVLTALVEIAGGAAGVVALLGYLAIVNLVLAIFNLIPAFPLDGGRVYRAWVWNRSGDILEATRKASDLGATFAYLLIGLGCVSLFLGAHVGGLWQIMIGLFLLAAAKTTYQRELTRTVLEDKTVSSMMTRQPVTAHPDQTLAELVNRIILHHRTSFVPVVENGVLLGYVDSDTLAKIDRENWPNTQVGDIFVGVDDSNSVAPSLAAEALLDRISETGRRKFLVTDGRHLLGVIAISDLMSYLSLLRNLNGKTAKP